MRMTLVLATMGAKRSAHDFGATRNLGLGTLSYGLGNCAPSMSGCVCIAATGSLDTVVIKASTVQLPDRSSHALCPEHTQELHTPC